MRRVCIVGLGYVGLTLAVAMADAGYEVVGVERSRHIRDKVAAGQAHFREVGLDEQLAIHVASGRLTVAEFVRRDPAVDAFIITVGTPLSPSGAIDLGALDTVLTAIAAVLKAGDTVVLRSTVKVGTTRNTAKAALDAAGVEYRLAFCPERTLEGRALKELRSLPQIVGGLDEASTVAARALFERVSPHIVAVATVEVAEMVKLLNNTYRDIEFAFANEVAEICDAMGLPAMDVIHAACDDYERCRIPDPGPVGGPCLSKDGHILAESLRAFQYVPRMTVQARRLNEDLPRSSMARVARKMNDLGLHDMTHRKIVMLGLAFKGQPPTNDTRGTMAKPILEAMREQWPGAVYAAFDPLVEPSEFGSFGVSCCTSLEEAFDDASLIVIQNNNSTFRSMPIAELSLRMATPGMIYDYWNLFERLDICIPDGRTYISLGGAG